MIAWFTLLVLLALAEEERRILAICDAYDEDEASREDSRYLWGE